MRFYLRTKKLSPKSEGVVSRSNELAMALEMVL